jgi:hypothetical protein
MGRKSKDPTLVSASQLHIRSGANDRLITLNALKASDEITEEQSRQVCTSLDGSDVLMVDAV